MKNRDPWWKGKCWVKIREDQTPSCYEFEFDTNTKTPTALTFYGERYELKKVSSSIDALKKRYEELSMECKTLRNNYERKREIIVELARIGKILRPVWKREQDEKEKGPCLSNNDRDEEFVSNLIQSQTISKSVPSKKEIRDTWDATFCPKKAVTNIVVNQFVNKVKALFANRGPLIALVEKNIGNVWSLMEDGHHAIDKIEWFSKVPYVWVANVTLFSKEGILFVDQQYLPFFKNRNYEGPAFCEGNFLFVTHVYDNRQDGVLFSGLKGVIGDVFDRNNIDFVNSFVPDTIAWKLTK